MYLKQPDIDAHGLIQECPGFRAMREGMQAQGQSAVCRARKNCFKEQRRARDTAGERATKRIKLQFADRPVIPASSGSASPATPLQGLMLHVQAMERGSLKMRLKTP